MSQTQKIGELIRDLRIRGGLTQIEFANLLKTSQSAVARIERGEQNMTLEQLAKIGTVLQHPLINISENWTDDYLVTGGKKLSGEVTTHFSKNGAIGLLCAALVNKGTTTLHGIPRIESVFMLIEVLESIGVIVKWIADNAVTVKIPKTFSLNTIDRALARKLPSIIMIIPSLLHHLDSFELPLVGTNRTRRVHGTILKSFGINMEIKKDSENPCLLISKNKKAQQLESLVMPEASDTGMQVALIMSLLQKNPLILYGAQENYMTQDLMGFISKLGCTITRNNSLSITISSEQLVTEKNIEYCNSEDPTESFFFVALAIITKSNLSIKRVPVDFLRFEFAHLEAMGQKISYSQEYLSYNEITKLVDITLTPSELSNTEKVIHALPYPGINTDNLPLFVAICAHAGGTATLLDWMNEDRILYYRELKKFGMKIETAGSHKLFITDSRESMHETSFFCSEQFRPSTLLLLLALSIEGTSNLRNIYAIKRGYEKLDERLKEVGAQIELVTSIL